MRNMNCDPSYDLHQGDALAVLRTLASACVDAVITDPPYCSGGQTMTERARPTGTKYINSGTRRVLPDFEGDFRDQRGFLAWASQWLSECFRLTRPGGVLLSFID